MPWCPKCKSEYRVGFTVCADCGTELVDEEPAEESVRADGKNRYADDMDEQALAYLEEMARQNAENREFTKKNETQAESDAAEESGERNESDAVEENEAVKECNSEEQREDKTLYVPYQDSSELASENRSSGWILMIIGTIGIVLVILGVTEILPIRMGNPYLFYGVMGAVFILFLVSGIMSIKNAKIFDKKAESENSLKSTLLDWCKENLEASKIDQAVMSEEDTEEILYFKRFSYVKERLNRQFMNLDQGFLDKFIDDTVYEEIFKSGE